MKRDKQTNSLIVKNEMKNPYYQEKYRYVRKEIAI